MDRINAGDSVARGHQAADLEAITRADRVVIQGATVLSMDPALGDFVEADIVIDHGKVEAVGPRLGAVEGAAVIDARDTIVIPGFVDTHHHCYQGLLRGLLPDGRVAGGPATQKGCAAPDYLQTIWFGLTPSFSPSDAAAGVLLTALGALERGITTVVDTSQVAHTPEHTDACVEALLTSGVRSVFAFFDGSGQGGWPADIRRLQSTYCASDGGLLTLGLHAALDEGQFALAREVGAQVVTHFVDSDRIVQLGRAGQLGPDITLIHCTSLSDDGWSTLADTGVNVSLSPPIEMTMGHGVPPIQKALDHGIAPGLSTDVETTLAQDFFTVMRSTLTLQRMGVFSAERAEGAAAPERAAATERGGGAGLELLTARDVLEMATIGGARSVGLDRRIGSITPGKDADLVLLRADRLNVWPVNNAVGAVVNLMDSSNIAAVLVAGKVVKWNGRLVGVDERKIRDEASAARDRVLDHAGVKLGVLDDWRGAEH